MTQKKNTMFKPLDKKRYFEQIAQLIREKILRENLEEGFKFPTEQQLARDLNVSRSVLREALRILDVMGYVDIRKGPQGGIFVTNLYYKPICESLKHLTTNGHISIDHLFDVRLQIEPFAAAQAVQHAKKTDLKRVSTLIEDAALHMDDVAYLKSKDMEFHLLLADISGNPVLSILMRSVIEILREIAHGFLDLSFEKELFQIHRNIFRTITQKKVGDAKRLVKTDILFVKKNLKTFLKTQE